MSLSPVWLLPCSILSLACGDPHTAQSSPGRVTSAQVRAGQLPTARVPAPQVLDSGDHAIGDTLVRPEDRQAIAFLELLKSGVRNTEGGFNVDQVQFVAPDSLLAFIADSGLEHVDINDGVSQRVTLPQLRSEISARSGRAFLGLAHLAAMYALPYPQYSQLTFRRSAGSLVINAAAGYELTFLRPRGRWQLTKLHYLKLEGE